MVAHRVTLVSDCIVTSPWPEAFARHVRVLINPANVSLSGTQRAAFPRGGPVPPPVPPPAAAGPTARLWSWFRSEETRPVMDDLLYPAQAVDGLVHAEGTAKLRAALAKQPILERRETGEHVRCRVGEAVLTAGAFNALPFDAIVHTVPPFWSQDGDGKDSVAEWETALRNCYRSSFRAAIDFARSCDASKSAVGLAIATPVLGSGARGAPMAPAARVLADAVAELGGERVAEAATSELCLRVVVNPSIMAGDLAAVEAAVLGIMDK